MKTLPFLPLFTALASLLLPAHAHVGSPNVFFEGKAGPHAVRVSIRPPNALPGIAQVDVRVLGDGVTAVSVQSAFWQNGAVSAPDPVPALAVAGDAHLFNAAVWLLRRGSYSVQVTVESPLGHGTVAVPLQAAALVRPDMPPTLGAVLSALGVTLFFSAVWIAAAAVPARRRITAVVATLVLATAITGGAARWRKMDRDFRSNALAKPIPVNAIVRDTGSVHLLRLTPGAAATADWAGLAADHGKLMHLFLIRADDGNAFAHLHPVRGDAQTFEGVLPPLPAGGYHLYGEITRANGTSETLTAEIALPAPRGPSPQATWIMVNEVWCQSPIVAPAGDGTQPFALDADDSWHTGPAPTSTPTRTQVSRLMGGGAMVFQNAGDLVADRETTLRFALFSPEGEAVALQSYMGMLGHSVVRRDDGTVFTHLHPLGTISMAAQEIFTGPVTARAPALSPTNEVAFPYAFPRPGEYRVWTQVRLQGRVLTGVFDVRVRGN